MVRCQFFKFLSLVGDSYSPCAGKWSQYLLIFPNSLKRTNKQASVAKLASRGAHLNTVNPEYFVRTQFSYPGLSDLSYAWNFRTVADRCMIFCRTCFVPFACISCIFRLITQAAADIYSLFYPLFFSFITSDFFDSNPAFPFSYGSGRVRNVRK